MIKINENSRSERMKNLVRVVDDWPEPGISFKDLTPLWADNFAMKEIVWSIWQKVNGELDDIDYVVAPESRGFIVAGALAFHLGAGFIPARKSGKLPPDTFIDHSYQLEYGPKCSLEMPENLMRSDADHKPRVLVHDDVLATGGTAAATGKMVKELGGEVVLYSFIVELYNLDGCEQLDAPVFSILEMRG